MLVPQVRSLFPVFTQTRGFDRMLDGLLADLPSVESTRGVFPAWNVTETESSFVVDAELPGFSENELEIRVVGDELSLSGTRESNKVDESVTVHRRERFAGKFTRSIRLGTALDATKVEAKVKDGLLTVTLPKAEAALPRKISVRSA